MGFRLPNGSTIDLAQTYATSKPITTISNANPAVVSSVAHGYTAGDYVEVTSGWLGINGRIFRVASVTTDSYALEGADTTDVNHYPAGTGGGSTRKITAWVQIAQITDVQPSGGEQQFYQFGFLEESDDRQLPTTRSPMSLALTVADDPSQAYVAVAEAADQRRTPNGLRLNLADGVSKIVYNGYLTISETPALTRNQLMTRTLTFSMSGRPVRYNA